MIKKHAELQALQYRERARKMYVAFLPAVALPLSFGIIAGVLVGLFVGACLWAVEPLRSYASEGAIVFASGTSLLAWFFATRVWYLTWREIEATIFSMSVPTARGAKLSIPKNDGEGHGAIMPYFRSLNPAQLSEICLLVHNKKNITYRRLRNITGSDGITAVFYEELVEKGMAEWRDEQHHRKGIELTPPGWRAFRDGEVLTPLPHREIIP